MIINRHNYEEFFILYLDNELNETDRRQVEEFAQSNPDLQEELNLLLQSKLSPDMEIVLENKETLLKQSATTGITLSNYEEWFLLYTDNELNIDQQRAVEKFVAENPAFAQELTLFQQTKSEPEANIVFPNKELLYRQETKTRVIGFRMWRVAAAAILLIGMSASVYMLVQNKKAQTTNGLANTGSSKTTAPANNGSQAQTADTNIKENELPQQQSASTEIASIEQTAATTTQEVKKVEKENRVIPVKEDVASENPLAKNNPEPTIKVDENRKTIDDNKINSNPIAMAPLTNRIGNNSTATVTPEDARPSDIQTPDALTQEDVAGVNQSGKKNKLRGFFRKVTRTIEKTTNIKATDDEDRLLLAGLAIKL